MKIAVLGAGYVGLVTGACLSRMGHEVHVHDVDESKIDLLQSGKVPIHEPGLEELIAAHPLHFWPIDDEQEREHFDAYYIAVGTPRGFNGNADLSHVKSAAAWIRETRDRTRRSLVIIKSTVPPGTASIVREIVNDECLVSVISNPEFLKEGTAIHDFMHPDRIIVGALDQGAVRRFAEIYADWHEIPVNAFIVMSNESAELAKYASNGMLATRISFMNEMARISHAVGAHIDDVKRAVAADSRIGAQFLNAGPGWGGSCFPKDLHALANMAYGRLPVVEGASRTNGIQMVHIADRCLSLIGKFRGSLGEAVRGAKCTIWGAAFKPDTDDTRNSPVRTIAQILSAHGVELTIHDPVARLSDECLSGLNATQVEDMYEAANDSQLVVLLTDWSAYLGADWARLCREMATTQRAIFDTRNVLERDAVVRYLDLVRL